MDHFIHIQINSTVFIDEFDRHIFTFLGIRYDGREWSRFLNLHVKSKKKSEIEDAERRMSERTNTQR